MSSLKEIYNERAEKITRGIGRDLFEEAIRPYLNRTIKEDEVVSLPLSHNDMGFAYSAGNVQVNITFDEQAFLNQYRVLGKKDFTSVKVSGKDEPNGFDITNTYNADFNIFDLGGIKLNLKFQHVIMADVETSLEQMNKAIQSHNRNQNLSRSGKIV